MLNTLYFLIFIVTCFYAFPGAALALFNLIFGISLAPAPATVFLFGLFHLGYTVFTHIYLNVFEKLTGINNDE